MHEIMKYFLLTENQQQCLNSDHVLNPANPEADGAVLTRNSWYSCRILQGLAERASAPIGRALQFLQSTSSSDLTDGSYSCTAYSLRTVGT